MPTARGRKAALLASVLLMCFGSLIIALTPSYETIGVAAPILLVVARLLQGLSVGGEYGTSATYLSEMANKEQRGFFSSFQYVTLISGQLIALAVLIVLQQTLTVEQLESWGWRVPFFIGALCAVVAMFLRRGMEETESFSKKKEEPKESLLRTLLRHPEGSADRGRPDHGRHPGLLHLHHLHAEVPGEHGRHEQDRFDHDLGCHPVPLPCCCSPSSAPSPTRSAGGRS